MPAIAEPPHRLTADGSKRRIGVEIEFGDLPAEAAAGVVHTVFGGTIERIDRHAYNVRGSEIGEITVELDTRWAHPDFLRKMGPDLPKEILDLVPDLHEKAGAFIGDMLENVLPAEVVMPPIPFDEIDCLPRLCDTLEGAGATGTAESIFGGFGLHLNVEAASLEAAYLTRMMRAYLLLCDWLREKAQVDLVRQLGPFITPFPQRYRRKVIDPAYSPSFSQFLSDYLDHSPTRNRDLDLLPILATIDESSVRSRLPKEKIRPRPAFHYRLPSCRLGEPDWNPLNDWANWVRVEELAEDESAVARAADDWLRDGELTPDLLAELTGEA